MLSIGVIGTGIMGAGHARFIAAHVKNAQVTALADIDPIRVSALADELGTVVLQTNSPEELMMSSDVDAIIIASPDSFHVEHLKLAIASGKPTLCEKPIATNLEDARAISAEIQKHEDSKGKKIISFGFMRRFDPGYMRLREEIESGKYGNPMYVKAVIRNHLSPGTTSTGIFTNMAVHDFDIYRWLFKSDWESVSSFYPPHSSSAPDDVNDPLVFVAKLKNGITLVVDAMANGTAGYDTRVEVVCERGNLEIGPFGDFAVRTLENFEVTRGGAMEINWMKKFEQSYINELLAWVGEVESGVVHPDLATHKDALIANESAALGVASIS